ncbi:hypothetical protein NQD34_014950 [Periophthalmus magnuspinnatus]|nr:hypothetical protein NQD34_014950 [Periophthalmus magnuspinnatus]
MGNCCCCQSKGPCDSAEETSLLQNDSKATVPPAETPGALSVGGTCGPGLEEDISKGQLNKDAETETYNTQENGTLQKSSLQTDTSSNKSLQHTVNPANAAGVDTQSRTAHPEGAEQHSILTPPQMGYAHTCWNVSKTTATEEEHAAVEEKCLNGTTAAAVCTEPSSFTETKPKQEHSIMDTINNNSDECSVSLVKCANELSTETVLKEEVKHLSTEVAASHSQVFPISEINEEVNVVNIETSCCVDKVDPESRSSPVCVETSSEETQSHVPESSVDLLCSGSDHRGVEGESSSVPKTTAAAEENQSSQQVEMCDPESLIKEACPETTVENTETNVMSKEAAPSAHCEEKQGAVEKAEIASSETLANVVMSSTEQQLESSSTAEGEDALPKDTPAETKKDAVEDLENSEEDLYRGAEELSAELTTEAEASSLSEPFLKLEERCSLAPAVDILSYSEREWKGNTTKSALIRKGYKDMSHKFSSLRRVRGDNYCALRATLYQVLCHTTQMPQWLQEDNITMLPKDLEAQEEGLICQWIFPGECLRGDGTGDAVQQLRCYMELLQKKWQAAVDCASPSERQQLCEQWFQGGEEELALLEALKLLMLARAVELHRAIQKEEDTPLFCWLLFARDSSDCPHSFLANHLSHVGLSAGLEQVEMFLLGYALQCTIQVYRLYKADTEEFITFYPDDHKDDWPCVCLVTEDDRHYNVPVPMEPRCS